MEDAELQNDIVFRVSSLVDRKQRSHSEVNNRLLPEITATACSVDYSEVHFNAQSQIDINSNLIAQRRRSIHLLPRF